MLEVKTTIRQEQPLSWLEKARAIGPMIDAAAAREEYATELAEEVVRAIDEAGLFAIMVPRELGGAASAREVQLNALDRDALPVSRLVALEREASGAHPAAQQLHQRAAARQGHRADVAIDHRDGRGALGRALVEALPRLAPEASFGGALL